ncbi:glyoxalase/bleomycin resistance/dioxygenase family protein [Streptomyces sp. SP18CM02]|uniref:glyoxalase/bleomycin resistance/dioxygenase family protein n=1 Tax=Streptomyces sp. SP18CM02 TaxID=2758571 RepID=UPI00168C0768|nr:glyoxalase/bleomycin resistance/dioxygenase family protein [Streptomyces sp. SP18CM02]MBD3550874.1 glyoxalase/bleomycin resistance/dioxygenase family protein [Streptomyces sp. SP18CM02]
MHPNLIVIYTDHLDACHAFYTGLGLTFAKEQHGTGPEHYATELDGQTVLELYPATTRRPATGSLRLGLTLPAGPLTPPAGRHTHTDPDGRTVVLTVTQETHPMTTADEARTAIHHAFGDTAHTDIKTLPAGNLAITITKGDHAATIDGHDSSGWGWTIDPADDDGFTGHDTIAPTLNEALTNVRAALI